MLITKMRRKRLGMWLLILGFSIILSLAALSVFENRRGARQLEAIVDRFKKDQVELSLQKVLSQEIPDQDNAAVALIELTEELRSFSLPEDVPPPPAMRMVGPGSAASFVREAGWPGADGTTYGWEELRSARHDAEQHLPGLIAISQRPRFLSPIDATKGLPDVELKALAPLPAVSRILRTLAISDLHYGIADGERAVQCVTTLLNLFATKSEDPFTIAEMVRASHSRTAFTLTWEVLQHADVEDETWASLQTAWEKADFLKAQDRIWQAELTGMVDLFQRLKASRSYRRHILDNCVKIENDLGVPWAAPTRGFWLYQVHAPLWRVLWADQDFAESLRTHEIELRLAQSAQSNSWDLVRTKAKELGSTTEHALTSFYIEPNVEELSLYDRWRFLFSNTPSAFHGSHILRAFQAETEARLALTAIALHRHQIATGAYPPLLADLVPRFLPRVPVDPMDGNPLKYRHEAADRFLLYSVGTNGKDDDASNSTGNKTRTIWDGEDAIWPQRATP